MRSRLYPLLLIPFAALLVIHPLLVHGVSCGQDMAFHLQGWLDAAQQLRHGNYPQWAFSPAWNAGEPRFIFYPPLSWLLGAFLTTAVPISAVPIVYIFLALTASGFTMHHLARHYVSPNAALLASVFYLGNPYMLFCAFERTAFAELLAAAWIPLLFLAVLRPRPTVRAVALPIALLWLTNAPAAVMGCYTFALLAILRIGFLLTPNVFMSNEGAPLRSRGKTPALAFRLAATCLFGILLGLALPAFYLIPAAVQRKYVQIAMAVIPNLRYQDNFLFAHTADAAHNAVNHTASTLAVALLILTFLALAALLLLRRRAVSQPSAVPVSPTEAERSSEPPALQLAITTLLIACLLTPLSAPLWAHLPNLVFLQFPWRFLTIISAILAFTLALLLNHLRSLPSLRSSLYPLIPVFLALLLTVPAYRLYAQACDGPSLPTSIAALFHTHHGAPPTDEYTPTDADNDVQRTDNPGFWLAQAPNDPAPNTVPRPAELNPNLQSDDNPVPDDQTLSTPAPHHFSVNPPGPRFLVLNLRDYPTWRVAVSAPYVADTPYLPHIPRNDGLIALPLLAGPATVDITWQRTSDQTLGLAISLCALLFVLTSAVYRRRAPSHVE